jgi:lipid-A-disaccharide synthase
LARRLLKVKNVSLPNLLANESLVPELIQHEVTAENLGKNLLAYFENPSVMEKQNQRFAEIHQQLKQDAGSKAAEAILQLVTQKNHKK